MAQRAHRRPAPAAPARTGGEMGVDAHQHLWPEDLLAALARRSEPPLIRRHGAQWWLELAGEGASRFDPAAHDPDARARQAERDGIGLIGVAPSLPVGIESLAPGDAAPLLAAYHEGILALGSPFALWASAVVPETELASLLDRGALGACLPAAALAEDARAAEVTPVLDLLEARGRPLFVHPGPAPAPPPGAPAWWQALTAYVAEMHAAWLAWAHQGRARHPRLHVLFAMLAGGAPLHAERLAACGGPTRAAHDERTHFDVSSYGVRTIDAM